jgi:hypothetical protein
VKVENSIIHVLSRVLIEGDESDRNHLMNSGTGSEAE